MVSSTRLVRQRERAERFVLSHRRMVHRHAGMACDAAMMRVWIHRRGSRMDWDISEPRAAIG